MLVPINTDAPLYHPPYATVILILANTLCFILTGCALNEERLEPWLLQYGEGINPLQWLSSMFAHASWGHLIGNMFFLWGFGLVVEGKLGFRRFLQVYLGIGLLWGAGVDLLTVHRTDEYVLRTEMHVENAEELARSLQAELDLSEEDSAAAVRHALRNAKGRCLGASGAIFGLMAISCVWAPKNEMHIVGYLMFRVVSFDVTILTYSLWYLVLSLVGVALEGFAMGTPGLHLVGAVIGFAVGVVYLKKDWVNCENWDLFAVLSGKYGRFADDNWSLGAHARTDKVYEEPPVPQTADEEDEEAAALLKKRRAGVQSRKLQAINAQIDSAHYIEASEAMFALRLIDTKSQLDHGRLKRLALGLWNADVPDEAEIFLQEFVDRFPEDATWAKLLLSEHLLQNQRPGAALAILRTLRAADMTAAQKTTARTLLAESKQQVQAGVKDAETEW